MPRRTSCNQSVKDVTLLTINFYWGGYRIFAKQVWNDIRGSIITLLNKYTTYFMHFILEFRDFIDAAGICFRLNTGELSRNLNKQ